MATASRKTTIKDVARKAGVALSTASYVLNNADRSISSATRERVFATARSLGYEPNQAARSLITRRTNIISLWISDVASPFSSYVIARIQREVCRHGYELLIAEIGETARAPRPRAGWRADGTIAYIGPECRNWDLAAYFSPDIPLVSIGALSIPGTDFIEVDLYPGTFEAVSHLRAAGCSRVAYLVPEGRIFDGDYRYEAYRAAMRAFEGTPEYIVVPQNSRTSARDGLVDHLRTHRAPDAIFCYNDGLAIGAYRGLRDLGFTVTNDPAVRQGIVLVGCDGIEDLMYLDCPPSTIALPIDRICDSAWEMLEDRMRAPDTPPRKVTFAPEFVLSPIGAVRSGS